LGLFVENSTGTPKTGDREPHRTLGQSGSVSLL
jgi:hypothetical protein